jgi:Zn-dependent protease
LDLETVRKIVVVAPVLLFSMVAHEYAHGWAALRQGDETALRAGRLTWNPVPHIDLWMTVLLPAFLLYVSHGTMAFGGAKPVPVDPRNFRNYRRGDIIVSLAGVATNALLALLSALLFVLCGVVGAALPASASVLAVFQLMAVYGVSLNLLLAAFNLIPIPPLDGSHVVAQLLPPTLAAPYRRFGRFGLLVLILLIQTPFLSYWFAPVMRAGGALLNVVRPFALAAA